MLLSAAAIGVLFVGLLATSFGLTLALFLGTRPRDTAAMYLSFPRPQSPGCGENLHWGVRRLLDTYREHGYWPTLFQAIPSGDARYRLPEMLWDFWRDPDLRPLLALTALPQLLLPRKRDAGMCPMVLPDHALVGTMHSNFFTALTAEEILRCLKSNAKILTEREKRALWSTVDSVVSDLLDAAQVDNRTGGPTWNYTHRPRIANRHFNEIMMRWSSYPDMDSTAVTLSFLSKYARERSTCREHPQDGTSSTLVQRAKHVIGFDRIADLMAGQMVPARHNILPRAQRNARFQQQLAIGTYFTDASNDVDPGVNVDVLECILECYDTWSVDNQAGVAEVARSILDYLSVLHRRSCLFAPDQHFFYPPPAFAYLWARMRSAFLLCPSEVRRTLDPGCAFASLDSQVHSTVRHLLALVGSGGDAIDLSSMDRLLLMNAQRSYNEAAPHAPLPSRLLPHEFFYALYPIKIRYASTFHMLAAILGSAHSSC